MIIRGLWNIDGTGFSAIPEEYQEFAAQKRRVVIRHIAEVMLSCCIFALAIAFFREGEITLKHALDIVDSCAWILAFMFANVATKSTWHLAAAVRNQRSMSPPRSPSPSPSYLS
mmetsp:Transcript_14877/g.28851  ORF Transcript_14877/g.28851 Transcript_14877/m.28851 type:complete len:114 (+) Transcript_14877:288-629(+)